MRNWSKMYAGAVLVILFVAVVGCNLLNENAKQPTAPGNSSQPVMGGVPGAMGNFYVTRAVSDQWGVKINGREFIVNVPKSGVFLLTYSTKNGGTFFIVTKVKKNATLFVTVLPDDEIEDVSVNEGDATAVAETSPEAQDFGGIVVLYRPGWIGNWTNFMIINDNIQTIVLIKKGIIIISNLVIEIPDNLIWKPIPFITTTKPHSKAGSKRIVDDGWKANPLAL